MILSQTFECESCGAIIKSAGEMSLDKVGCICTKPKMKLVATEFESEKDKLESDIKELESAKLKLSDCYQQIVYAHNHYLDWDSDEIKLQSLWDIATYFYNYFNTFPYKFVTAMKGSGKSRLLALTESLCHNGKLTTGMSDSALFRSAKDHTLIFDEAEQIARKEKQVQRQILNSGYKKGSVISLIKEKHDKDGKRFEVDDYPVYGPKMLANIFGMEEVLGDRCIQSILEKSNNPAKTKLVQDFDTNLFFSNVKRTLSEVSVLRCMNMQENKCIESWNIYISSKYTTTYTTLCTSNYIQLHQGNISKDYLDLFDKIDKSNLDGRNLELYFPLFIIAKYIGDDVLDDILRIAEKKITDKRENELIESKDIAVIDFISNLNIEEGKFIPIKDLASQFRLFFENDDSNLDWLNAHWFARAINRLALVKSKKRIARGMEIIPNVLKAKEKIKIFKSEEKKDAS